MADPQPLVTWALTTFNQEGQIARAIECAFAQDYPNLEIIVSDDCSTDGTATTVRAMVAQYDGPHQVRANVNAANLYIGGHISLINRLARGDLVVNAAGDDVSVPHRASRLVEAWIAADRRPGLLHSACYRVDERGRTLFESPSLDRLNDIDSATSPGTFIIGATEAWDRRMFRHFGDLRPDLTHEDHALIFRSLLLDRPVAYVREPLVDHHHGGLTTYRQRPTAAERMTILRRYLTDAEQKRADLSVTPRPGLEARLKRLEARYRASLQFEAGWPSLRQAVRLARDAGPWTVGRLAMKRGVNQWIDTRMTSGEIAHD